MPNSKKYLLYGAGFGFAFAFTLSLIVGIWLYCSSRPKLQGNWDRTAVKASFDRVELDQNDQHLVFYYELENETDQDYLISSISNIDVKARLDSGALATCDRGTECVTPYLPITIPARQKLLLPVHLTDRFPRKLPMNTPEQRQAAARQALTFVQNDLPRLNGFTIFDKVLHYEIDLPGSWRAQTAALTRQ